MSRWPDRVQRNVRRSADQRRQLRHLWNTLRDGRDVHHGDLSVPGGSDRLRRRLRRRQLGSQQLRHVRTYVRRGRGLYLGRLLMPDG